MVTITTKHTSTATGAGRVLAKGGGKQRTIEWDHSVSSARNHGNAAGELALALGLSWHDDITHNNVDNSTHKFNI